MKSTVTIIVGIAVSISFIIISLSVGYYFVVYLPNLENQKLSLQQQKQEQEAQSEKEKTINLKRCETEAYDNAKSTLKSRVELMEDTGNYGAEYELMKQAVEKGLYNKDDYNQFYESCLKKYGL